MKVWYNISTLPSGGSSSVYSISEMEGGGPKKNSHPAKTKLSLIISS